MPKNETLALAQLAFGFLGGIVLAYALLVLLARGFNWLTTAPDVAAYQAEQPKAPLFKFNNFMLGAAVVFLFVAMHLTKNGL